MSSVTCTINASVLKNVEELRLCKKTEGMKAYVAKIDAKTLEVVDDMPPKTDKLAKDERFKDTTLEEVTEDLPDNAPRYLVLSYRYEHKDKRVSYPLVLIYYCPGTARPADRMLYASTQQMFATRAMLDKVYLLEDKDDFTQEWLDEKVAKFSR
ncbi:hypothetical protein IWW57_003280 [Coemansia sp. S610]|uniref:ADF-H domain-containing protein n=2 Tax=Coemansia TaxID=4863 RepID=A0A9W8GIV0_9FUNG|nr:hypothetical protein LPJ60_002226 [Coemansia sp. RSA 2675]KAJ2025737.1 hypothetical protein IWW57_003280 [Coemansia sp. S610]KAJ2412693.1 hypothetical protein GGI10_003533 [Coemansia sp. RSA 2530]KAJ2684976.1 hypothetical protein IWW39_004585 [Coemansia spiralis]KAJ2695586.1 hypothetical protein H4218_005177 [Coemansia sp. IMI 209128]KAJ2768978.1 hypothetical protein GGI18_005488 [Coemansia linderi]